MPSLLQRPEGLRDLIAEVLNQVLQAQLTEHLGADRHERSEDRAGYRNGYRERTLYTRVGPLTLRVPQTRDGSFAPEIFERYRRNEQALVLALMEMVVNGVSTRKVARITEELCGTSFSKSTVSRLATGLDVRVQAFLERKLEGGYPFVIVDAMFTKVRGDGPVVSKALLIASGVRQDGHREVLGLAIGDAESASTWSDFFRSLKRRGVDGVDFVISDDHAGLVDAIAKNFSGATWQRCQVHVMRNLLGHAPARERTAVLEAAKLIFASTDLAEARRRHREFADRFAKTAPKAVACMDGAFDDAMAVMELPLKYRRRLKSTNMQERLNEEIRRRERVIRIFPNDASAIRLVGALLEEINENWSSRQYFDMTEYLEWREERRSPVGRPKARAA
jgi:transposase-like protein